MQARRVLFICSLLDAGGAERHWSTLIPLLRTRGFEPRLLALKSGGRAFDAITAAGVPTRVLRARGGIGTLLVIPSLLQERSKRPEVVVTWGADAALLGCGLARLAGIPHVIHWHAGPGSSLSRRQLWSFRLAARLGGGAIAVTRAQFPELASFGYPAARIRIGQPGIPPPAVHYSARVKARAELDLPADGFVAAAVARLSTEKRLDRFLRAVSQIHGATALLVGDGPDRAALERLAAELSAPVKFVGYTDSPADYMTAANAVCLTSEREALPLSILEAAACGRPAVAMEVGGIRDIVEHGVTGLVTPQGDIAAFAEALARLADAPNRADEMGAMANARWQERFSLDAMIDSYASLLRDMSGPPVNWPDERPPVRPETR